MELLTVNELTITDSFFYIDGYAFLTSATTSAESKGFKSSRDVCINTHLWLFLETFRPNQWEQSWKQYMGNI